MHAAYSIQVKHCHIEISFSVNNNNASQKNMIFNSMVYVFLSKSFKVGCLPERTVIRKRGDHILWQI